ncbi:MAG: DUF58 domain-containing protein, partial [Planctomycetota bacterium]|nr:DUF58 domain-containing protein [Planctomycetota bacterium]
PFVDGDPVNFIDWKVTARTGRFHVKEFEALKTMPIYLIVDTSASMGFSSQRLSKYQMALLISGGLGLAGLRRLSPVGIIGGGERQLHYVPSLSRNRVFRWLHDLRRTNFSERTCIAERLDDAVGLVRERCLFLIVSDLHDPEIVPSVKRGAQRNDCVVLHLEDPAERGRLRGGIFRGREAESDNSFAAHGRSQWFAGEEEQQRTNLQAGGIDYLNLKTDQPFVAPLRHFLVHRGGLLRNAR